MAFGVCFLTGLISHLHQHPVGWFDLPSRPVWGYQLTQGVHVATGIASVPLLLAKLWTVYRRLFAWPPARDVGRALERLLLVPLVAGAVFELVTGLLNVVQWYPFHFAFPVAHYAVAWVTVGAMLVHLALKAPLARSVTGRRRRLPGAPPEAAPSAERRALLIGTGAAVGAVTLATVGQAVEPLRAVSLLAPRDPAVGPQGLPVNRSAAAARVAPAATDPAWRLVVAGSLQLSLAQLQALPQVRGRPADRLRRGVERDGPLGRRPASRCARPRRRTGRIDAHPGEPRAGRVPDGARGAERGARPAVAARPAARQRAARARPRVSAAVHRPEPARRAADQVAEPDRGRIVSAAAWWRWPALVAGLAALAYGLLLLVTDGGAAPVVPVVTWLAGSLVLHDALLAPLTVLAGVVVTRLVPRDVRPVVAGGLVVAACLVVVALPALGTPGVPDNPSATPRDYPLGLAVLLALDAAVTALLVVLVRRRSDAAAP